MSHRRLRAAQRSSWLHCHACQHDLNGDTESFIGEIGNEWHYRCSNCGATSVFSLDYPTPVRVAPAAQ